jgi:hypothetical protein
VFAPDGRVGTVRHLLYGSSVNAPDALVIESGLFRKRILAVPVDDVESLTPNEARVDLRVAGSGGRS